MLKVIQPVGGRAGARAQDSWLSLSLLTAFHGHVSASPHSGFWKSEECFPLNSHVG